MTKEKEIRKTLNKECIIYCIQEFLEDETIEEAITTKNSKLLTKALETSGAFIDPITDTYKAMKYLIVHDIALTISMGIAAELGYAISSITSCILATLVQTKEYRKNWESVLESIDIIINE